MAILTLVELRKHIDYPTGTDADAALQLLLDATEEAIVKAAGASGAVTEFHEGGWSRLILTRPAATLTTVTVDYDTSTPLVLSADDYRFTSGGHVLSRLGDGTNPHSVWSGTVQVIYTPTDDTETRKVAQLALIRMHINDPGGLTQRTIGDWSETFASDDEGAAQRASILAQLTSDAGVRVI